MKNAIKMSKNNKSPGTDGISVKMLKVGGDEAVQWLWQICNQVWTSGIAPRTGKMELSSGSQRKGILLSITIAGSNPAVSSG